MKGLALLLSAAAVAPSSKLESLTCFEYYIQKGGSVNIPIFVGDSLTGHVELRYDGQVNQQGDLGFTFKNLSNCDRKYSTKTYLLRNKVPKFMRSRPFTLSDYFHVFQATKMPSYKSDDGFVRLRIYSSEKK
ncbi:hypothetical protein KY330_05220 [Candidatus Woesearchaeota archaeon]|nr:hypothetical protein [Candidatus Woesearchaeota archaeon]